MMEGNTSGENKRTIGRPTLYELIIDLLTHQLMNQLKEEISEL